MQEIKRTVIRITAQMGEFSPNKMENRKSTPWKISLKTATLIYIEVQA